MKYPFRRPLPIEASFDETSQSKSEGELLNTLLELAHNKLRLELELSLAVEEYERLMKEWKKARHEEG